MYGTALLIACQYYSKSLSLIEQLRWIQCSIRPAPTAPDWRVPPDGCNTYSSFSFVDARGYSEREVSFSINAPMSQGLSKPVKIGASCLPATLALLCV